MEGTITENEIKEAKAKQLQSLAIRFSPPVKIDDLKSIPQVKQRLLQALENLKQTSTDKHEDVISDTREKIDRKSKQLHDIIEDFLEVLAELGDDVSMFHLPDQMNKMLDEHKATIQQKHSEPFLVAGEISSGKSTFLNILMKEDLLPTRVTSCTGRMCEMSYGENLTVELSQLKEGNRVVTAIASDKLEHELQLKHLKDRLQYDVLKITLPATFLKNGITLIDSPGWGNNEEDNNVVLHYSNVRENELSGLICTFNCSAGGGITDIFKKQLHKIVEARKDNGERKLNPQMILFVATFWDGVDDKEKEATRAHIIKLIRELPFMGSFEPDTQLFFMNGKHVLRNMQAGIIDGEVKEIYKGIQTVLLKSHRNKLDEAYQYIEARVEDALRCILNMERMSLKEEGKESLNEVLCKADEAILRVLNEYHAVDKLLQEIFQYVFVSELSKLIQDYLQKRKSEMSNWKLKDLASVLNSEDEPEAIAIKIEDLIWERMFDMLIGLEMEEHFMISLQSIMVPTYDSISKETHDKLSKIERSIRCNESSDTVNYDIEEMVKSIKHLVSLVQHGNITRSADTDVQLYSENKTGDLIVYVPKGVTMFLDTLFKTDVELPSKESKTYENDLVAYTKKVAKAFSKEICKVKNVNTFLESQLQIETIRKKNMKSIKQRIENNRLSIGDLMQYNNLQRKMISAEQLKEFMDRLLQFKFQHLIVSYFPQIELHEDEKKWQFCGLFGNIQMTEVADGLKQVTVKKLRNTTGSPMRYHDASNLIQTLRSAKALCFLGDCNSCTGIVFEGHLYTAREHFLNRVSDQPVGIYMKLVKDFLLELVKTLQMLHLNNFLHIEVSLDSILVKIDPSEGLPRPVLTHLNERKSIDFPPEANQVKNLIYLPPEVISGYGKTPVPMANWYKSPGDVYGMGLLMLELFSRKHDIFEEEKAKTLEDWMTIADPGTHLFTVTAKSSPAKIPDDWTDIIENCVDIDPKVRKPMLVINHHLRQ